MGMHILCSGIGALKSSLDIYLLKPNTPPLCEEYVVIIM